MNGFRNNPAFYFANDLYAGASGQFYGRYEVSREFLRAFIRHAAPQPLYGFVRDGEEAAKFRQLGLELGQQKPDTIAAITALDPAAMARPGILYMPDPGLGHQAWRRRYFDQRRYGLCGLIHSLSPRIVLEYVSQLMVAPLQRWDALVCSSRAGRAVVQELLERFGGYLEMQFGARASCAVELPIIPLGVDCDRYARGPGTDAQRARMRGRLNANDSAVVILYAGRLDFLSKMTPTATFLAVQRAQQQTQQQLHLVMAGWFQTPEMEELVRTAAREACPAVPVTFVDGRNPELWGEAWAAADVFTSLSDNVQETFGLTPVQAMAAGLPVVVSDWDGYRDTVCHGQDGFLVDTWLPPAGAGDELGYRFAAQIDGYDMHLGYVAQMTAVDVGAAARAFAELAASPDLRKRMGESGRARARSVFDWSAVLRQYDSLWSEMNARRAAEAERAPRAGTTAGDPLGDDPFRLFASFSSRKIGADTLVTIASGTDPARVERFYASKMNRFSRAFHFDLPDMQRLIAAIAARGRMTAGEIASLHAGVDPSRIYRAIAWAAKQDIVSLQDPP